MSDEIWMQRALDLAQLGGGFVVPNPWVGCVIVRNNQIIGEGYHAQYGGPHAEVNAFKDIHDARGSTVYVSLEPCSHTGKTPPCADLLVKHQVSRVVICNLDPNPLVAGKGVAKLHAAGIEVKIGVLAEKGECINRRFFYFHRYKRPYVTVKFASSSDQFIAQKSGKAILFSNPISQALVHRLRSEHHAILVGVNTVNNDDPSLTTRTWPGQSPMRLILDPHGRTNPHAQLLKDGDPAIFFTYEIAKSIGNKRWVALGKTDYLMAFMNYCYQHGIQSVLVEGGTKTINALIERFEVPEIIQIESDVQIEDGLIGPETPTAKANVYPIGTNNLWKIYEEKKI